ncbi:ATP-binding protein [Geodermatophilus sp. SYSU D01176]
MRRRITLLVAATTSVVLLAFLLPASSLVARVAEARALDAARVELQLLVPTVGLGSREEVAAGPLALSGDRLAVRWSDGTWLGTEGVLGDDPAPAGAEQRETAQGTHLLQPVRREGGTAVLEVFVPAAELRTGVAGTRLVLVGLGLVLLLLALVVADRVARSLTCPLSELATTAQRLGSGDLSARVTPDGPPEVREVGSAVNRLAGRIGELLADEREAAADLAHRLRTPLTALRLDVEALPAAERDRLRADVDALGRGIDEVIAEARRSVREGLGAGCDAAVVVHERVRFWSVLAEEERRPLAVDVPGRPLPVRVSDADLGAAVDALLGNVFAHTPERTGLHVAVGPRDGGGALVTVRDDGPGLPVAAVRRGYSGGGSTGLGLDIARRTAEGSGGALRVASSPAGTDVTLELGPPPG